LRALEALSGSRLLERSTRGVVPTEAGRRLYEAARRLLAEAEAVEELMGGLGADQAPVRLAASPTMAEVVLPPLLVELESQHDHHLSIELSIANSDAARKLVVEGRAELGVVAATAEGSERGSLVETPFHEDEIVVGVSPGHPWAELGEIPLEEFATTPTIMRDPGASSRRVVSEALEPYGLTPPPPLAEIGSTAAAITTALAEGAPVLISSLALTASGGGKLVARKVAGLDLKRRFVVVHTGEEGLSAPARALLGHLLQSRG
jgi:DNA-binding transcriptional LysR family regulator